MGEIVIGGRMEHRGKSGRFRPGDRCRVWSACRLWWAAAAAAVALVVISGTAWADEEVPPWERNWTVTVAGGGEEVASRDDKGAPLAYTGIGYPVVLRAVRTGRHWSWGAEAGGFAFVFNGGQLSTDMARDGEVGHRADSVFVDMSTWGQRRVVGRSSQRLSLGLQLSHWTFFRSYLYDSQQIGSVETWDAPLTGDARLEWARTGARLEGAVAAAVTMGGRIMRPGHSLRGDERLRIVARRHRIFTHGQWVTVNRLQMVRMTGSLRWRWSGRWGMGAQYRFGWMSFRDDDDLTVRAATHRMTGGIFVEF